MADTGKQSPLGQNVLGGILKNDCLEINKNAARFMGASKTNDQYNPGILVTDTVLRLITWAINWGWETKGSRLTDNTYDNLIDIGQGVCPALGNAKPPTYVPQDPQGVWAGTSPGGSSGPDGLPCKSIQYGITTGVTSPLPGPASAGYSIAGDTDQAQSATWYPYNTSNPNEEITKWGWIRCHALQAWCEFNFHGTSPTQSEPKYEDFTGSFLSADSFINSQNKVVIAGENGENFLEGTFSNMDDLITSDISGINLAIKDFGQDLDNLGKLFDPRKLDKFGFPSTILQTIYENGGIVQDLNLALGGAGLSAREITTISNGTAEYITASQERKIYSAFLLIGGDNLRAILAPMLKQSPRQRTTPRPNSPDSTGTKFRTLADCLDVKRLFPTSYRSLTVPIYNTTVGLETGSKTYYLIYKDGVVNSSDLNTASVKNNVGTLFTQGIPPVFDDLPSTPDSSLPKGFDSYLGGPNVVVPAAIGLAAGALRYTMLQVSNITNLLPGEFGTCMSRLELMTDNVSTGPMTRQEAINNSVATTCPEYWYAKGTTDIVVIHEPSLSFYNYRYETGSSAPTGGPVDPQSSTRMGTFKAGDRLTMNDPRTGYTVPFTLISNNFTPGVYPAGQGIMSGRFDTLEDALAVFPGPGVDTGDPNRIGPMCKISQVEPTPVPSATGPQATGTLAKPVNEELHAQIPNKLAIGSGPAGTYTHSDFFGCMSGLPYPWQVIFNKINQTGASQPVERSRLNKIYEQTYLTVTWENAIYNITVTTYFTNTLPSIQNPPNPNHALDPSDPNYEPEPYLDAYNGDAPTFYKYTYREDDLYYTVTLSQVGNGGGYGRGFSKNDPDRNPEVKIYPNNCNASITNVRIGTDNSDASPYESGPIYSHKFGRVTSQSYNNGSPYKWESNHRTDPPDFDTQPGDGLVEAYIDANCPQESITTEAPPTGTYDAYFTGATNQPGLIYVTPIGGGPGAEGSALSGSGWATPVTFWGSPGNSVAQNYIDQANTEVRDIASTTSGDYRGGVRELNLAWNILGRELVVEQRARYIALTPVEIPRNPFVNSYETLCTFVDSMPELAQDTKPHMSAQTIEMIVDRFCPGGQSTIAMMRQERNQTRLTDCGIPMNNNIPSTFDNELLTALITNGTVTGARNGIPINDKEWTNPSWPYNPGPGLPPSPIPETRYQEGEVLNGTPTVGETFDPIIIDIENPQVGPITTIGPFTPPGQDPTDNDGNGGNDGTDGGGGGGGGGGLPVDPVIVTPPVVQPPGQNTVLPSVPTVDEAIDQVIKCNCDCWDILGQ